MMRSARLAILAPVLLVAAAGARAAGPPVPLGRPDFYPGPKRTVGFRGDGNGAYPGATPVTSWTEGTPAQRTVLVGTRKSKVRDFADRKSRNICWRVPIRGFGNSHPIVVGDRVITTSDPYWLVCIDIRTGKVLWQRATNPFDLMELSEQDADALDEYVYGVYAARAPLPTLVGNYTRLPDVFEEKYRDLWGRIFRMTLPPLKRLVTENRFGEHALGALEFMEESLALLDKLGHKQPTGALDGRPARMCWQGSIKGCYADWIRDTYGLFAFVHWDGWTGFTFASPCSDGAAVYQWIGQGQIVSYDLAGNRRWGLHYPYRVEKPCRGDGVQHLPSPVLAGNVLVAQTTDHLVGVSAADGKLLWEVPNGTHHFSMGTAKHLRLENGTDVVIPTSGKVIRVRDGVMLGNLGVKHDTGPVTGGESMVGVGNRIFFPAHRPVKKLVAFDIGPDKNDKVEITKVWELPGTSVNDNSIVIGDLWYRFGKPGDVINWRDGKKLEQTVKFTIRSGGVGPILAGKHVFWYESGRTGNRQRQDGRLISQCQVLELDGKGGAKTLDDISLLDGTERPDMVRFKEYNPGFWASKRWDPQGGVPAHFGHGGFAAQGNRLFLRSLNALYCFGDPATEYNWDASARPESVHKALAEPAFPDGVDGIVARLRTRYRWEWEQAARRAAALPANAKSGAARRVGQLLTSDSWYTVKAAALTLRSMAAAADSAADDILGALTAALDAGDTMRGVALTETLMAVAPARAPDVLEPVRRALTGSDARGQIAACRVAACLGAKAAVVTKALARIAQGDSSKTAIEAARALARIGPGAAEAVPALGTALRSEDPWLVEASLAALRAMDDAAKQAVPDIARVLKHKNPHRARQAAELLGSLGKAARPATKQLTAELGNAYPMVAEAAVHALFAIDPNSQGSTVDALRALLKKKEKSLTATRAARAARPQLTDTAARKKLITALGEVLGTKEVPTMAMAAITLGEFGKEARPALSQLRHATLGLEIPKIGRAAIKKIDPSIDVKNLQPEMDGAEDDDLDLGLDL